MMDSTIGTALSGLFGTLIALAVVLGLAWLILRAVKRWQDRGGFAGAEQNGELRFVRALAVGQRERVMLIEAEGERMLIGVAQNGVTLLRNWGEREDWGDTQTPVQDAPDLPEEYRP